MAQNVSPTDEQYENGVLGGSAGGNVGGNNVVVDPNADQVGDLPFTGLDVAAIAAIGVGLLGAGLAVRKVARTHGDHAV